MSHFNWELINRRIWMSFWALIVQEDPECPQILSSGQQQGSDWCTAATSPGAEETRPPLRPETLDISQPTPCGNNETTDSTDAPCTRCISYPNTPPFPPPPTRGSYKWATASCPLLLHVAALRRTAIRGAVSRRGGEMEEKKKKQDCSFPA